MLWYLFRRHTVFPSLRYVVHCHITLPFLTLRLYLLPQIPHCKCAKGYRLRVSFFVWQLSRACSKYLCPVEEFLTNNGGVRVCCIIHRSSPLCLQAFWLMICHVSLLKQCIPGVFFVFYDGDNTHGIPLSSSGVLYSQCSHFSCYTASA